MMRDNYAHNDYLQGLAELGLVGFSLVAAFLSLVFDEDRCLPSRPLTSSQYALPGGCLPWIDETRDCLHSVADFNLYVEPNAMLLSWVSAIAVSFRLSANVVSLSCPSIA